jgi:hypothetical protein
LERSINLGEAICANIRVLAMVMQSKHLERTP